MAHSKNEDQEEISPKWIIDIKDYKKKESLKFYIRGIRYFCREMDVHSSISTLACVYAHFYCYVADEYKEKYLVAMIFLAMKKTELNRKINELASQALNFFNLDKPLELWINEILVAELHLLRLFGFDFYTPIVDLYSNAHQLLATLKGTSSFAAITRQCFWLLLNDVFSSELVLFYKFDLLFNAVFDVSKMLHPRTPSSGLQVIHLDILRLMSSD